MSVRLDCKEIIRNETATGGSRAIKVVCFLFDPNVGGPTIRARSVYEQMIPGGYSVSVVFPEGVGSAVAYMSDSRISVDRLAISKPVLPRKFIPFLQFLIMAPLALFRVRQYLRRERPDVVHVNGAFDVIPAVAAKLAGVPLVWHLNDTVFGARLSLFMGRVVRSLADVIVVAATRVGTHYGVAATSPHVIYAPVDVEKFPARDVERVPRFPATLTLIANWNWIKGQERFISVLLQLRRKGADVRGLAIGRFVDSQAAYWKPLLSRVDAEGLADFFEAPGFVDDTSAALSGSDLLLLTSHSEACPMAVLEAMSVGVPVVSFDVGGVSELLGSGPDCAGIVVPNGDIQAMVDAIESLLHDPASYRRMAANGQRRARSEFSLSACVQRHCDAYAAATNNLRV